MSDNIYNNSAELANLISAGAQELVNQSRALGLTWGLRLATMSTSDINAQTAIFDGDTTPLTVTNMSGAPLTQGQRVYGLIVPPAGNFIVAQANIPLPAGVITTVAGQALANSSSTGMAWTSTSYEEGGGFYDVSSGGFITIPDSLAGLYNITANIALSTTVGTRKYIDIRLDFVVFGRSFFGSGEDTASVSGSTYLDAGTFISVNAFQNSGAPITMDGTIYLFRVA